MARLADTVPNTPILSAWHNTNRDRTVVPFVNAAERATQWVTPGAGATSYLQDVNSLEVFNGTAWVPVPTSPAAYQTWTPTWFGAGAAIGNSSVVARYQRLGRQITGYLEIGLGSSSIMATDQLAIALPTPAYVAGSVAVAIGAAAYWKSAVRYPGSADIHLGTPSRMRLFTAFYGVGGFVFDDAVRTNSPFAWSPAATDRITVEFSYEAAT